MTEHEDFDELEDLEGRPDWSLEEDSGGSGMRYAMVIGIIVAAAMIGFMIFDGMEAQTYFYTADEAVAQGSDLIGQTVRIKGVVEVGTVVGEAGKLGREFRVAEKGKSIKVSYDRAMPDTFKENAEVVVHGEVNDDLVLEADEVLVKCPSRYEGAPPTQGEHPAGIPKQAAL